MITLFRPQFISQGICRDRFIGVRLLLMLLAGRQEMIDLDKFRQEQTYILELVWYFVYCPSL